MTRLKLPLLLLLALFVYRQLSSGAIHYYINRRFVWLIWLALWVLGILIAGDRIVRRLHVESGPEHDHGPTWRAAGLLLVPLVLGLLVPPQPLGTAALAHRDLNLALQVALVAPSDAIHYATEQRDFDLLDWLLLFQQEGEAAISGQAAELTGFVYRRSNLAPDTWLLNRYVISCCAADAIPVGIAVRAPGSVAPSNDQWVRVVGRFSVEVQDGQLSPILLADAVTPVDQPEHPYLYGR
jgi:putative membrane protein